MLALLIACSPPSEPLPSALTPREQLIRLSVDLRGVHPTETELTAIEANPALYEGYADRYLDDPRFGGRLRELFNLRFLTRTGDTFFDPVGGVPAGTVADSIGEEPLRLLSYIYESDLPYSYLVTAQHTMADPIVAQMWNLERTPGEGWQPATWTDGRPAAGLLSMTTIWQRYPSMGGNANRHRANAISRMLLCDDYLARPIVLNRAAVDLLTIDPENAIAVTDTCQSCHSTLDPLAGNLFGFFHYDADDDREAAITYRPENEGAWRDYSGKEPGYFGRPTASLVELGEAIAADTRFSDCAVRTVWEGFAQVGYSDDAWEEVEALRGTFTDGGLRLRPLVRRLVTQPEYRSDTVRVASPAQLAAIVEAITGYDWAFDGRSGLTTQDLGLPGLSGGVDSRYVTTPSYTPSLGVALVQERLAQAAGRHVAEHDLAEGRTEDAILLRFVTAADTPTTAPDAFEAQIRALYLDVTGLPLPADAPEPAALATLWTQLYGVEASPTAAWAGLVSVVLRDPRVLFY